MDSRPAVAGRLGTVRGRDWRVTMASVITAALLAQSAVPAQAQIAVFDAAVFGQTVLTVKQTLEMVSQGLRHLAPMTQISLAVQLVAEMQLLMQEIDSIASQISGRQGAWTSTPTITTFRQLAEFRYYASNLCHLCTQQALRVVALIAQVGRLLRILTSILEGVQQLIGTLSGLQQVSTHLGEMSGQLVTLAAMQATSNESILCERWQGYHRQQAMEALQRQMFSTYGITRD